MIKLHLQQFAAPGHTTPIRSATFQNLQLNAGIFIANADYSSIANATALKTAIQNLIAGTTSGLGNSAKLLGATRGGGTFTVTREIRVPEVDGRRYGFKGDSFVDSVDAQLTTTLIEITKDTFLTALAGTAVTGTSPKETIKLSTVISTSDYLTNVCWIGDRGGGKLILICLKNALNVADLSLTFTDKGEGTLPVEFHAKQDAVNDYDQAPFEIVYFTPGT